MEGDFRENSYGMTSDLSPAPVAHHEPKTPVSLPCEPSASWVARSYQAHRTLNTASIIPAEEVRAPFVGNEPASRQPLRESHESPEMTVNTDSNNGRQKVMGGSSLQSLSMFLDLYLRRSGLAGIGSCFRHGMSFCEEYVLPLSLSLPDLPPHSLMERYIQAYTRSIQPLYPVLQLEQLYAEVHRIRSYQDASWSPSGGFSGLRSFLQPTDVPILACIYCVISLGSDEVAGALTEAGSNYLAAAYGLYAHLVGLPHLSSAQALVLIALALQSRGKEGQSCQVLGSAVKIAHSIGIHRHISAHGNSHEPSRRQELHARIWWTCYAIERLYELETTRPSSIPHGEHDPFQPDRVLSATSQAELKYFVYWVSLTTIFERISGLLYRRKRSPEGSLQLLQNIGMLDRALRDWKNSLPEDIRPDCDFYCVENERPFATFLALHYHQALITLHRASLVLPHDQFLEEIETHAENLPYHQRLRNGASLCSASACATIKLNANINGRLQTPLHTLTQILHGCIVLGLSIMRQPHSRTVRSDLELLVTGTQLAEGEYCRLGQHPLFIEACSTLRRSISTYVEQHEQPRIPRGVSQRPRQHSRATSISMTESVPTNFSAPIDHDTVSSFEAEHIDLDCASLFEGVAFEDLWTMDADAVLGDGTSPDHQFPSV
ncbi:hypothetical protein DPSP01_010768 [Paraphaeosphaeria sporulosa]